MNSFLKKIENLFWRIAEHYYSVFLVLVFSGLIFGAFLFYENFVLVRRSNPPVTLRQTQIKEEILEKILEEKRRREQRLMQIDSENYSNPFEIQVEEGNPEEGTD